MGGERGGNGRNPKGEIRMTKQGQRTKFEGGKGDGHGSSSCVWFGGDVGCWRSSCKWPVPVVGRGTLRRWTVRLRRPPAQNESPVNGPCVKAASSCHRTIFKDGFHFSPVEPALWPMIGTIAFAGFSAPRSAAIASARLVAAAAASSVGLLIVAPWLLPPRSPPPTPPALAPAVRCEFDAGSTGDC